MTLNECERMRAHPSAYERMRANANYNDSSSSSSSGNVISSDSFNPTPPSIIEASPLTRLKQNDECRRIRQITIAKAYRELAATGTPSFTLSECVDIIEKFMFEFYECFGKQPHPFLNSSQFQDVIVRLPSVDDLDLEVENYDTLIPRYFEQCYAHCNYHIFHFLSGKIRLNSFYKFCI